MTAPRSLRTTGQNLSVVSGESRSKAFYNSFHYRAELWDCARRVAAQVEWHVGELFLRVGFLVTKLSVPCLPTSRSRTNTPINSLWHRVC